MLVRGEAGSGKTHLIMDEFLDQAWQKRLNAVVIVGTCCEIGNLIEALLGGYLC
jgi:hypothetical protein